MQLTAIPWLGEIPTDWKLSRIKNEFKILKTEVGDKSSSFSLLSLTLQGIKYRDIESGFGKFPAEFNTYQIVKEGDLVFCLFDIEETPRTIGLSDKYGMITGAYTVLESKGNAYNKYFYYLFLMVDLDKRFKMYYSGLRNTIKDDNFKAIPIPLPPFSTQKRIADHLDKRCDQVKQLITDKKRMIELLREQKQAIIHHTVMRGLDDGVKMKDSGMPWLGKIPENWAVRKLKYSVELNKWKSLNSIDKKIGLENIESWTGRYLESEGDFQGEGNFIKPNDVLFGKLRPNLAKALLSNFHGVCVNEILVLTPNPEVITAKYLFHMCLSSDFINLVASSTYGSKMPRAEWGFIGNIQIPLPSIPSQKAIVEYIEKESEIINSAIAKIEQEIVLIEEYKKSLIYHAVTGKITV